VSEQSSVVCLLNGFTSVRERGSEGVTVLECHCAHTDTHWIQLCRVHGTEDESYRRKAREDHDRGDMIRELTS
jgi:hypothetical protein